MARVVIADAGPLIALAGIERLNILRQLFSEITITQSVMDECLAKDGGDAQRIAESIQERWLIVHTWKNLSAPLSPSLGRGESDSIRLALESPQDSLLIMDDRLARRYALRKGLKIIGTVRVLDLAEKMGLIKRAEHCIQELADFGYRVSMDLLKKIRS
jgi:predicted nucleic acid-binding protein